MKTKLFLLSLAVLGLRVGAGAQDTSVVFGTEFHIDGVPAQGGTEIGYQWQCNGDDIGGAQAIDYTTVGSQRPGLYTYVRKAKCAECENWQFSNPFTIAVVCPDPSSLRPVRFTDSATTVCVGTVFTYAVPNVAGTTYQWAFPAGWGQTTGANTNSVKVRADSATGSVSVTAIHTASGCASTARAVTVATVNKPPTLTLASGNNLNQRVFSGVAISAITYTRGGTTNGNAEISGNPTGVTVGTSGSTITVSGTPSVSSASAYTYTVTAKAAASCPTAATATGTIVSTDCASPGVMVNNKCYKAKGNVVFTGTTSLCQSWFGTEYVLAPYTDAQYFACGSNPFSGVLYIFTGTLTDYTCSTGTNNMWNAQSTTCGVTYCTTPTLRPNGVALGGTTIHGVAYVANTTEKYASVGHLCVRNP